MTEPQPQDTAPATARVFTPEELAAARRQIAAQAQDATQAQGATSEDIGLSLIAAGADAAAPDPAEMLRQIRAMQARITSLESEKRMAAAPELVKFAQAFHDHVQAKAHANPGVHADPDATYQPALDAALELVKASKDATASGDPSGIGPHLDKLTTWVTGHARSHPSIDYGYILQLLEEAAGAAAKLAA